MANEAPSPRGRSDFGGSRPCARLSRARPPLPARDEAELPPSYAEFRETVEILDRRANSFATQSLDLIIELRRAVDRGAVKREPKTAALLLVATLAACVGFLLGRMMQ